MDLFGEFVSCTFVELGLTLRVLPLGIIRRFILETSIFQENNWHNSKTLIKINMNNSTALVYLFLSWDFVGTVENLFYTFRI